MKTHKNLLIFSLSLFTFSAFAEIAKQDSFVPPVVTPGVYGNPDKVGKAPSDAIVLFDGNNFDQWESSKGGPVKWKLIDGAMEVVRGTGVIQTKKKLGYGQYHVEWRTPDVVKGSGQGRGNSGFFPLGGPEVQVLDSYKNSTYSHGQAGSIYNRYPPLVNACRAPGVWQTYDVIVHAPVQDKEEKYIRKSAYTVLHNGVLIQDNMEVGGSKGKAGNLRLQDHGNPVRYRNIWHRPYREPLMKK
ncbi:MAG: DUF1080 domain-containing protein [Opitutae bacterium]|nr:DUF1080 domain-containing protein [Opitutae bacterium]